jgi:hypothetical protein
LKNVQKNLPQQAKISQNIAKMLCGTPKTEQISVFFSHFPEFIFEK